jgi:hypothetical protein
MSVNIPRDSHYFWDLGTLVLIEGGDFLGRLHDRR